MLVACYHEPMDDNLSALSAGFTGTAVMTALLVAADAITPFDVRPFEAVASFVGIQDLALGFFVFVLLGTVAWSFIFITIGQYLPGERDAVRGMVFSVVLWTGFVTAFSGSVAPGDLPVYAAFTLFVHLAYGFTLGAVYERLADHEMAATEPVAPVTPD